VNEYFFKKDDILYFLHIPKTAGTSLTKILENNFKSDEVLPEYTWPKLLEKLDVDFSKYRLIRGHFGYWIYKLLSKTPVTLTILRKPIDQTLSLYSHQLRAFEDGDSESIIKHKNETLEEIFEDPGRRLIFTNHQIRHLTLDFDVEAIKKAIKEKGKLKEIRKQYKPKLITRNQAELLKIAKDRLTKFAFFGLAEKFEESLFLLCYTFGWFPPRIVPKLNISSKRKKLDDLPKETSDILLKLTRFDEQLYQYAEQVFDERFKNMVEDLKEKYYEPKFKDLSFREMMYEMLEKHYFKRKSQYSNKSVYYEFSQKELGSKWYQTDLFRNDRVFRGMKKIHSKLKL